MNLHEGSQVCFKHNRRKLGVVAKIQHNAGGTVCTVNWSDGSREDYYTPLEDSLSYPDESNINPTLTELFTDPRFFVKPGAPEKIGRSYLDRCLNTLLLVSDQRIGLPLGSLPFEPKSHQFKPMGAFYEAIRNPGLKGILIADEVGLGKTIEAGLIFKEMEVRQPAMRVLVVCPASLKQNWIAEWKTRFNSKLREYKDKTEFETDFSDLSLPFQGVVSYNFIANLDQATMSHKINLLILDESHELRNSNTSKHKNTEALSNIAEYILLLSATPLNLKTSDLSNQLKFIAPFSGYADDPTQLEIALTEGEPLVKLRDRLLNRNKFDLPTLIREHVSLFIEEKVLDQATCDFLCQDGKLDKSTVIQVLRKLEAAHPLALLVSRTRKKDTDLPEIARDASAVRVTMTASESNLYHSIVNWAHDSIKGTNFKYSIYEKMLASSIPSTVKYLIDKNRILAVEAEELDDEDFDPAYQVDIPEKSEQALGSLLANIHSIPDSKFNWLLDLVKTLADTSKHSKAIVFSSFKTTIFYLAKQLQEAVPSFTIICVTGGDLNKSSKFEQFRKTPSHCLLLATDVASQGLNFQFCNYVVNYDLPWNPMRIEQRIGRVDRIGQEHPTVFIKNLFYTGTKDEQVYGVLWERIKLFEQAFGDMAPILETIAMMYSGEYNTEVALDILATRLKEEEARAKNESNVFYGGTYELDSDPSSVSASLKTAGATELLRDFFETVEYLEINDTLKTLCFKPDSARYHAYLDFCKKAAYKVPKGRKIVMDLDHIMKSPLMAWLEQEFVLVDGSPFYLKVSARNTLFLAIPELDLANGVPLSVGTYSFCIKLAELCKKNGTRPYYTPILTIVDTAGLQLPFSTTDLTLIHSFFKGVTVLYPFSVTSDSSYIKQLSTESNTQDELVWYKQLELEAIHERKITQWADAELIRINAKYANMMADIPEPYKGKGVWHANEARRQSEIEAITSAKARKLHEVMLDLNKRGPATLKIAGYIKIINDNS